MAWMQTARATIYTAQSNGNWESSTTWSPGGGPPGNGDTVVIPSGKTVTVTSNNTANLANINVYGTLSFTNGAKLNFSSTSLINVFTGGSIAGGNNGTMLIFPDVKYNGVFNIAGPYYYSNTGFGIPLPLKWLSLTGKLDSSGFLDIKWSVAEEDIYYYEVEYSFDGITFHTTGTVPSKGDGEHDYIFRSKEPFLGEIFVRIRQTNNDNHFSYSRILAIVNSVKQDAILAPNPTTGICTIWLAPHLLGATADLFSENGSLVRRLRIASTTEYLDISSLPNGTYILWISSTLSLKINKL